VFQNSLPAVKIYSSRYTHYRFSALTFNSGTQLELNCNDNIYGKFIHILVFTYCKRILIKFYTSLNEMTGNFYSTCMHRMFENKKERFTLYNAALEQH